MEIKAIRIFCFIIYFLFAHDFVWADQVGSNSLVSIVPYTSFSSPVLTQNEMLAFGWMKNGFGMEDNSVSCTFYSAFPVSGHLSLHGGRLELATDFIMNNPVDFASSGLVVGNNHVFDIAQSVTAIPSSNSSIFKDTKIYFNGDLRIVGTVDLKGSCQIDGFGHRMILDGGNLKVGHDSVLTLKNLELDGVHNYNIYCVDDSARIVLDNIRWVQTGDYTFSRGSLVVQNQVDFAGPFRFFYTSSLTSTVKSDSEWHCSDLVELTMGRFSGVDGREPLYFEDQTAALKLENSTFVVTSSGMRFTRGAFLCDRQVDLDVNSNCTMNGFEIGDGTDENDLLFKLFPSATFKVNTGHLVYNVASTENFLTDDINVKFHKASDAFFHSKQDIAFRNITIRNDGISGNTSNEGVVFTFDNVSYKFPFAEYRLTGKRYSNGVDLLRGSGDNLEVLSGTYPFGVRVKGTGSKILGTGFISGQIVLHDPSVNLSLNWDGIISSNMALNGGTLIIGKDLIFAQSVGFTGTGKINIGARQAIFGTDDLVVTSSLSWNAAGGRIKFQSSIDLHSEWFFKGNCILDGSGKELALRPTGKIKIASDGTLHLKDMFISGFSDEKIFCHSDSSKIIFDNVRIAFDNDYSFTRGSFKILNNVDFLNAHTFFYQSALSCTIDRYSRWRLAEDIRLSIGRKNGISSRDPIYFEDSTSVIEADRATFSITSSGMRVTRGKLEISNFLGIETDSTYSKNGMIMGDGTRSGDFTFLFNPGSTLNFKRGRFVYENYSPNLVKSPTKLTRIVIDPGFTMYIQKPLKLKDLRFDFSTLWNSNVAAGAVLQYDNVTFSPPASEMILTGTRYSMTATLLDTNDKLTVVTGVAPLGVIILGSGNSILGSGNIGADIVMASPLSGVTWGLGGIMLANFNLGGGSVSLVKPLIFADNKSAKGVGKINLGSYYAEFGGLDSVQTASVYWSGTKGSIALRSNLHLTSRWTFSGDCTILGNGNTITFSPSGRIMIERGSRLRFKEVTINGVLDGQICCVDNAGEIIFDTSAWIQDTNFSFTLGRFEIETELTMIGRDRVFEYKSNRRSCLRDRTNLILKDDLTFSYAPTSTDRGLIVLSSLTSRLIMENATLQSTSTGMQLTKGFLEVHGHCYLDSSASSRAEGIIFGNGLSSVEDLKVDIYPESELELSSGFLVYKNLI